MMNNKNLIYESIKSRLKGLMAAKKAVPPANELPSLRRRLDER
jgi:DNA-binding transcriptional regulator YhcF (GntR family)